MLRFLTYNRRQTKLSLFRNLLFLVEQIKTFQSPDDAKANGFFFTLQEPTEEELPPTVFNNTHWDIPFSHRDDLHKANCAADGLNANILRDLQLRFPSLSVMAHWRKAVVRSANDVQKDHPDYEKPDLYLPAQLKISLHEVGQSILADFVRKSTAAPAIRCTKYSFMTIHIFALALRGIIVECMGLTPSSVERSAMGSCVAAPRRKNQSFVSLFVSGTTAPALIDDALEAPNYLSTSTSDSDGYRRAPTDDSATTSAREAEELNTQRTACLSVSWAEYLETLPTRGPFMSEEQISSLLVNEPSRDEESTGPPAHPVVQVSDIDVPDILDDIA